MGGLVAQECEDCSVICFLHYLVGLLTCDYGVAESVCKLSRAVVGGTSAARTVSGDDLVGEADSGVC